MGFDFVNTRLTGITGPTTVTSGSTAYQTLNANVSIAVIGILGNVTGSGSLIVRNGLIISAPSSSNQPY